MSLLGSILARMTRFDDQDLSDSEFRECDLTRARLIGVVMQNAIIDGLVTNLVVNGVEVTSYVEAELDRRHPVRLLIRSADPAELLRGFRELQAAWSATLERLRRMPSGSEHQRVGGEWSAVETMPHLVFVHDCWFGRCCGVCGRRLRRRCGPHTYAAPPRPQRLWFAWSVVRGSRPR